MRLKVLVFEDKATEKKTCMVIKFISWAHFVGSIIYLCKKIPDKYNIHQYIKTRRKREKKTSKKKKNNEEEEETYATMLIITISFVRLCFACIMKYYENPWKFIRCVCSIQTHSISFMCIGWPTLSFSFLYLFLIFVTMKHFPGLLCSYASWAYIDIHVSTIYKDLLFSYAYAYAMHADTHAAWLRWALLLYIENMCFVLTMRLPFSFFICRPSLSIFFASFFFIHNVCIMEWHPYNITNKSKIRK